MIYRSRIPFEDDSNRVRFAFRLVYVEDGNRLTDLIMDKLCVLGVREGGGRPLLQRLLDASEDGNRLQEAMAHYAEYMWMHSTRGYQV